MQTVNRHMDRMRQIQKKRKKLPLQLNSLWARWDMTRFKTIHLERTLDEASYPGLSTGLLAKRNKDQVVMRELIRNSETREDSSHTETPILLVAQLWLWRLDNVILSAHSLTPTSKYHDFPYGPVGSDLELEDDARCERRWLGADTRVPDLQLGLIIAGHIRQFGERYERGDVTFLPTLEIFYSAVASVLSDVDDYLGTESVSKLDIGKEKTFLHNISDIRNEVAMIQEILGQQEEILSSLINDIHHQRTKRDQPALENDDDERAWDVINHAKDLLNKYIKLTEKIDRDAERIEKAILDKLNLKRTHASIQDAHNSVILGAAVIGFTVVTIIFAPLSFLVGLFALPVDQFSGLQYKQAGNADTLKGKYLAAIFGIQLSWDVVHEPLTQRSYHRNNNVGHHLWGSSLVDVVARGLEPTGVRQAVELGRVGAHSKDSMALEPPKRRNCNGRFGHKAGY